MSYRINPDGYCMAEGCSRPRTTGEDRCFFCLVQGAEPALLSREPRPAPRLAKPPRCVAYLSLAGDVITLELTGEPKFTEADVELVASALMHRAA